MNPMLISAVEGPMTGPHISEMASRCFFVTGAAGFPVAVATTADVIQCAARNAFWSGVYEGLTAPVAVFSTPQTFTTGYISTPAQCFAIVGSYISESAASVIDDGRPAQTTEGEAA
jgi:hypothetical protein